MARPQEFDRDAVLDRATDLFWRYGYAGTSLEQVDRATALNRGSLYNAFGDKRGLYLACLDHYGRQEIGAAVARLAGPGAAGAKIRRLFAGPVDAVRRNRDRRGCLLCNAAVETAPHDTLVEETVVRHLGSLRDGLRQALAAERGPRTGREIACLADQLTAAYMGLLVLAKAGAPTAQLRRAATGAAALLGGG